MDKTELRVALLRRNMTEMELSDAIGINRITLYRKLKSGKFDRAEIAKIRDVLGLSNADMIRIFFGAESCENSTGEGEETV